MKKGLLLIPLLSLLLLLGAGAISQARAGTGQPPVLQVLDGSRGQLNTDSFNIVSDTLFFDHAYDSVLSKPYLVRNTVTLLINPYSIYALQGDFSATLNLEITKTAADGSTTVVDTALTVRYRKDSLVTDQDSYLFSNAYTVKVKVLSRSTDAAWNVWQVLELNNELQSFPVYIFDCTKDTILSVTAASLDSNTNLDELPVSWANTIGADEYDLEWTYIDSSALANPAHIYGTPSSPNPALIFDNNSSRVTITGTSYNIPILYDGTGTLFFRVRPVQLQAGGGRSEGHWSSDDRPAGSFYFKGHQRNLNWQSTASYAEEGKRKLVVQYYDGSLRGRQTVTKDNTTNTTIVAESFYDYQGRPVIQVLPAPTFQSVIGYSKNFNIGLNGSAYDKFNFDSVADPTMFCNSGAAAMGTDSGAAQYYSPSNPLKDSGMIRFIPDAHGYPFTELEYVQDNTGQINRQSGVGPDHRLGSGHETQYFYGTPDQHELDALFGTEVGDHMHYFKTMVQDANGQLSVSYTDMHGRTIATALAGVPPDSIKLDTLASYAPQRIVETISDASTNLTTDLVMESKKTLLVSLPGVDTFTYKLSPANLQLPDCHNTTVCYHCLYDLEITMTDNCDNQKLGGQAFDTVFHNFSLTSQIDTSCSAASGFSISFAKFLPIGSYEITKKLSVSRFGEDYYRDSIYLKRNSCQSQSSFLRTQDSIQASITQCAPSCSTCQDSLGDFPTFYSRFIAHAGIASNDSSYKGMIMQAYQQAQADCRALCDSANQSDDILAAMLLDLTPPSGQYANPDSASDPYSIFYVHKDGNHNADSVPPYRKVTNYLNAFGQPDSVYDEVTGTMVPPQLLSPQAFSDKFNSSWATALLPYHPEYCKLYHYQMLPLSPAWDKRFEEMDTYAGAMNNGYLNPTNETTTAPFSTYNVTPGGTADPDPLANSYNNTSTNNYKANLESQLTHYTASNSKNSSDSVYTMWEMATAMIRCAGQDSTCIQRYHHADSAFNSNMCTGDLDMAWRSFRQMYLDVKNHLINAQLEGNCPSPTVSALIAAGHQPHFTDAGELIAATGTGLSDTAASAEANAQSTLASYYASTCQAYVTMWWQDLRPCNYGSADSAILMPRLVNVCEAGSDANHPYGASSVNPSSTYPYKSFEDVITQYNDSLSGVSKPVPLACNAYTITAPAPYDQQVIYNSKPLWTRPDSCECNQIGSLYDNYQLVSGSYSSFSDYLNKVYQTQVTDSVLNLLLSLCNSNPANSTCNYFATPISLPPALQCSAGNSCVGCMQFKALDAEFRGKYPGIVPVANPSATDSAQMASNLLYTNFMNYRLGFSKTVADYLVFLNSCSGVADSTANGVGAAAPTTYDTAKISCNGLDSLLHLYKLTYLQPVTGYADLDMRTFAGNITPPEGPKGVFNIHGKLIGNTIDSSSDQVNISFAQVWNSDTADQRVGILSALSNGKFHLVLKPGQYVPQNGITGMRYYQFDDPYDTLDAVLTNLGSYIDFGDGQGIKVDSTLSNSTNSILSILYGNIPNFAPTYPVTHVYSSTATRTVTVYHTDIYGVLGFDNWLTPNPGRYLPLLKNLRGYAPEDCRVLIIHGSHDSTFNTFNGIENADQLTGIRFLQFQNGLQNYNFGSFQSLHNLRYIWFDHSTVNAPNLNSVFPNMPVNYPNLSYLEFGSNFNLDSINFAIPSLRLLKLGGQDSSQWVDRILNQLGPAVTLDSGIVSFDTASAARTSASNSAVSRLESMKWAIVTRDSTINMAIWDSAQLHIKSDSTFNPKQVYPIGSAFTDFINGKFGTTMTKKGVDSLFLHKCGVLPNTGTPDSSGTTTPATDTCSSYTFIHTYGGIGTEQAWDLVQTPDGGYFVTGQTNSFGNGGWDGFVMKTDKRGIMQWSKTYGGSGNDTLVKIRNTRDGGFIALGNTTSFKSTVEPFVVKGDANGGVQWFRTLDAGTTNGEKAIDIIQTSDGGYAVAATYDFIPKSSDWEVLRLDSTGGTVWAEHMGSFSSDNAGGLVEDRDTLVFSGLFYSDSLNRFSPNPFSWYDGIVMKINKSNGNIIWAQSYDIDSMSNWFSDINNTSGGYIINGNEQSSFSGDSVKQVVFQVDKNGMATTVRRMEPPSGTPTDALSMAEYPTSDGGFVTVQTEKDTAADVYFQKTDNGGSLNWTNRIKLSGNQQINHVIQNSDGTFTAAGYSGNHLLLLRASGLGRTGCHDTAVTLTSAAPVVKRYSQSLSPAGVTLTNNLHSIVAHPGFNTETTICYNNSCASGARDSLFLCGRSAPVFPPVSVNTITNCSDSSFFAVSKSTVQFTDYTDSLRGNFDSSYRALCLQAYQMESFTVTQTQSEYHHTLYYYDQAGNLLKTVPPAGVNANYDSTWLASVAAARTAGTSVVPSHGLPTQYRYNTLNQVMAQQTPDAGQSHFWYDRLGRLAISQNARQRTASSTESGRQYSYTLYDSIGRITEVGQISNAGSTPMTDSISRSESLLTSWIAASASNKEQITSTIYDLPYTGYTGLSFTPVVQRNLRNRVAYTTFALGSNPAQYNQGSFYTYDIEGNVDTLLQDFGSSSFTGLQNIMNTNGNRFKRMVYNYDLVSGKVNTVAYQPHQADAFYHRYTYDAENRLILTETSSDSVYWDKEARYQYYKHGPLARTIIGDKMVQGLDYAYTLQGWLKGVNSASLTPGYDMGRDGDTTWQNRYVAKDAFGFGLNYFAGDYSAIGTSTNPFPGTSAYLNTSYRPLFNGNISSIAVNIGQLYKFDSSHWRGPLLYNYRYDQLNRLTGMDAFYGLNQSTNSWSALTATPDFKERVAYDPNGNIQKYLRNNFGGTGLPMDSLGYGYMTGTNKLAQIRDSASDAIGGGYDLHSQPTNNYGYDSIGNLIKDSIEHISLIKWNVYGKITEIDHSTTSPAKPTKNIYYFYDAAGNRIGKKTTSGDSSTVSYTWYVRDASGNVMATYTAGIDSSSALSAADLHVGEKDIYGSSRLGLLNANYSVDAAGDGFSAYTSPWAGVVLPYYTGKKQYELANHLGNVLATISDKKIGVSLSSDSSLIDHYEADVQTAQDYYPFGMIMPGRMFKSLAIPGGSIDSGTSQVNGYTLPVDLTLTSRTTDMPNQYVATQMIDLDEGFQSGDSTDVFTAYIADTTYAGTGNGGSSPDGVAGQGKYRYGFNGKENDNEVKGIGDQIDYGMRIYDPRVGRFLSVDPLQKTYPWNSPYSYAEGDPINYVDVDGAESGTGTAQSEVLRSLPEIELSNLEVTKDGILRNSTQLFRNGPINSGSYAPQTRFLNQSELNDKICPNCGAYLNPDKVSMTVYNDNSSWEVSLLIPKETTKPTTWVDRLIWRIQSERAKQLNSNQWNVSIQAYEIITTDPATLSNDYLDEVNRRLINGTATDRDKLYATEVALRKQQSVLNDPEKVTFIQGQGDKAKSVTVDVPEGYRKTNFTSQKQPVYTNGKNWITPDRTGHNGGIWKMFDNLKKVGSTDKSKRLGTFDANLKKIGE